MRRAFVIGLFLMMAVMSGARAQEGSRFDLLEFEIVGNSVLAVPAVEQAVLPFLGEQRSIDDVELARAALEKAYQDAGYLTVLVDVPEQRVEGGVVQLRVTEGRVERLRVTGSRYHDQGWIRERVHQLAPGRVPDFNAMQQQLAAVTKDERQIQPLLRPGVAPGTVEAELRVTDRLPLSAQVELNNRHAASTTPLRAQATLRYDNLFQRDHSLSVTAITAPQSPAESKVLSLGWTAPLATEGDTLAASLLLSDSTVEPLGAVTVFGKGSTFGLRWARSRVAGDALHTFSAGADLKHLRERVATGNDALSTPVRYLPFSVSYSLQTLGGELPTSFSTTLTAAQRGLLARDVECPGNVGPVDQFACKREGADGSFTTLRGDLRVTAGRLSLRVGGQLAMQPLIGSEQFTIGGAETVRGYDESEAAGDLGWLASGEARGPELVSLWGGEPGSPSATSIAFVDVGSVRTIDPGVGQAGRTSLVGAGVGLRVRAFTSLDAELDLAWPLKRTANAPDREPRLHVRLSARF